MTKRLFAALILAAAATAAFSAVEQASFSKNGKYVGKIETYSYGGVRYFDATRVSKYLGGKIYWYPVSGKLVFQLKGRKVQAKVDSDEVVFDRDTAFIKSPVIVRGGKAYISRDFFVSERFFACFGFRLDYVESSNSLEIREKMSVASYNYFTHRDKTRFVLYLNEQLDYQTYQKENDLLLLVVPGGSVALPEKISVEDGVVRSIDMVQDNKALRIGFAMGERAGGFDVFKLTEPDRIVLDVLSAAAAPPAPEPAPEAITPSPEQPAAEPAAAITVLSSVTLPAPDEAVISTGMAPAPENQPETAVPGKRVIIDAGHGGKDAGGRRKFGLREKEINLAVAKELEKLIEKDGFFEALMVRTSDAFIPLAARSEFANRHKADVFISIHANATRNSSENGFEIYFMSENASDPMAAEVADYENSVLHLEDEGGGADPAALLLHSLARNEYLNEGSQLAAFVTREFEKHTPFKNRGVKQAAFYVLRGTYAPGILVEMGFMTNPRDQKNLSSSSVHAKLARAIHTGLNKYAELKGWR